MRTLKNQRRCKPAQAQEHQRAPAASRPTVAFMPARGARTLTWSLGFSGRDGDQGRALH
jgi:hypothetical protein